MRLFLVQGIRENTPVFIRICRTEKQIREAGHRLLVELAPGAKAEWCDMQVEKILFISKRLMIGENASLDVNKYASPSDHLKMNISRLDGRRLPAAENRAPRETKGSRKLIM